MVYRLFALEPSSGPLPPSDSCGDCHKVNKAFIPLTHRTIVRYTQWYYRSYYHPYYHHLHTAELIVSAGISVGDPAFYCKLNLDFILFS